MAKKKEETKIRIKEAKGISRKTLSFLMAVLLLFSVSVPVFAGQNQREAPPGEQFTDDFDNEMQIDLQNIVPPDYVGFDIDADFGQNVNRLDEEEPYIILNPLLDCMIYDGDYDEHDIGAFSLPGPNITAPTQNQQIVSTQNFTARWDPVSGATRYIVSLRNVTTNELRVDRHNNGTATTFPIESRHLTPGHRYRLAVAAVVNGVERWTNPHRYFSVIPTSGSVTIVYLGNGHTGGSPPPNQPVTTPGTANLRCPIRYGNMTRANYTFGGWRFPNGQVAQIPSAVRWDYAFSGTLTLTAVWNRIQTGLVTIHYLCSFVPGLMPASQPVVTPGSAILRFPGVRANYTFNGWICDSTSNIWQPGMTAVWNTSISGHWILHALWTRNAPPTTPQIITVTLNRNGGLGGTERFSVARNSNVTTPSQLVMPTLANHIFEGYWTALAGGNMVINANGQVQSNVLHWTGPNGTFIRTTDGTLFARWRASNFIPVTEIRNLPTSATAGTALTLSGTVFPTNATNQIITWSVVNARTTGATISGNRLNTTAAGSALLRATIANGTATGAFVQDFNVTVAAAANPSISVSLNEVDFGRLPLGYAGLLPWTIRVVNDGNQNITLVTPPVIPAGWRVEFPSNWTTEMTPGQFRDFDIRPEYGLLVGSHNRTLTIMTGTGGVSATVQLRFTVTPIPQVTVNYDIRSNTAAILDTVVGDVDAVRVRFRELFAINLVRQLNTTSTDLNQKAGCNRDVRFGCCIECHQEGFRYDAHLNMCDAWHHRSSTRLIRESPGTRNRSVFKFVDFGLCLWIERYQTHRGDDLAGIANRILGDTILVSYSYSNFRGGATARRGVTAHEISHLFGADDGVCTPGQDCVMTSWNLWYNRWCDRCRRDIFDNRNRN